MVDESTGTLLMLILWIWFLCPSHIACVLDELRHSRLELINTSGQAVYSQRRVVN